MPFARCVRCEPSFARTPGRILFRKEDETCLLYTSAQRSHVVMAIYETLALVHAQAVDDAGVCLGIIAVSYTHLDVYKRQEYASRIKKDGSRNSRLSQCVAAGRLTLPSEPIRRAAH